MNDKFSHRIAEYKAYQAIAFAEMHRLISECDRAEKHALEVLAQCK